VATTDYGRILRFYLIKKRVRASRKSSFEMKNGIRSIIKVRELGILIGFFGLFLIFALLSPANFLSLRNQLIVIRQVSYVGIMAIGMTMVIVSGEFDLSVGSIYGMAVMLCALLIRGGVSVLLSVLVALFGGLVVGVINGVLVTYVKIPSFIVTLGTLNLIRGFALLLTGGFYVTIMEVKDPVLDICRFLGAGRLLGIPVPGIIFIGVAVIGGIVYHKTMFGFNIRAVGGSSATAKVSGINVKGIKILTFTINGFLAALAGLLSLFLLNNAKGVAGSGLELHVIGATIIGGTSLLGGSGTILGTVIGVMIIGILGNGLILAGVTPYWQTVVTGFVIIAAVAVDMWTGTKKATRESY
jgi:ribose/xylose/arabinose/galactoside ABC-type transport system permease subunit